MSWKPLEAPMFLLWNVTDGIPAWLGPFRTRRQALDFARRFRARYKRQGYYLTAGGFRIDPKDIELDIRPADG